MKLSIQIDERQATIVDEWPLSKGLGFQACCGVIGPEVEANWITRVLDLCGGFERLISKHSKSQAIDWLVAHGHSPASSRVWADRYYLPEVI